MTSSLSEIPAPAEPVFRITRRIYQPFEPRPWHLALENGTFGHRFDDPGGYPDRNPPISQHNRFQTIYCASRAAGALGETIAPLRPKLTAIPGLAEIAEDEDDPEPDSYLDWLRDPEDPRRGILLANWRLDRQLTTTQLDPALMFVDLASPWTIGYLRQELAALAIQLGLMDVDLSTVLGPSRRFTQECARYVYEQVDKSGRPRYAGVRYLSRLNQNWECWAIFYDRMRGHHTPGTQETIVPDHPDLLEVASIFDLSIECFSGSSLYVRP